MLKFKRIIGSLMVLIMALMINVFAIDSTKVKAAEPPLSSSENEISSVTVLDISENNLIISDVLTYDELCENYAESENVTVNQAKNILGSKEAIKTEKNSTLASASAISGTYREIATYLDVTSNYKPMIKWYCETSESGSFWGITSILTTQLYREYTYYDWNWLEYKTITKQFSGELYTKLQSAYQIFFIVNGDFWDYGTTTVSGGGGIDIGEYINLQFSVSYANNHYKYYYYTDVKSVQ